MVRRLLLLGVAALVAVGLVAVGLVVVAMTPWEAPGVDVEQQQPDFSILVFSKTTGYRHDSIGAGVQALRELGAEHGFGITATEDARAFTAERLSGYAAVVFL